MSVCVCLCVLLNLFLFSRMDLKLTELFCASFSHRYSPNSVSSVVNHGLFRYSRYNKGMLLYAWCDMRIWGRFHYYDDVIISAIASQNHQPHNCLLNRLFKRRSKKSSKLRVTGFCVGNSPGTGEFPAQMMKNACYRVTISVTGKTMSCHCEKDDVIRKSEEYVYGIWQCQVLPRDKNGPPYRKQLVNPRHHIPQGESVTKLETPMWIIID